MGEPKVKKLAYTKESLTLLAEIFIASPSCVQTPKKDFSMAYLIKLICKVKYRGYYSKNV